MCKFIFKKFISISYGLALATSLTSLVSCNQTPTGPCTIIGGSTNLNGTYQQAGTDTLAWKVVNPKQEIVTATLSIHGLIPSSDFPNWIKITNDGWIHWTDEAVAGEYKFKIKAEIAGVVDPIYSEDITLLITGETYNVIGGSIILNGTHQQSGSDTLAWKVINQKQELVAATISIYGTSPSDYFPEWIKISNDGFVYWTNEAVMGEYKFKIKAEITGVADPIYSIEIVLLIPRPSFIWTYDEVKSEAVLYRYVGYDTDVNIPSSVSKDGKTYKVVSIEGIAFESNSDLISVTIPDSVLSINTAAFKDCSNLISVIIGSGVTSIGVGAFIKCPKLSDSSSPVRSYGFEFTGTIEQWKAVSRDEYWHAFTPATEIQCSDGVCGLDEI